MKRFCVVALLCALLCGCHPITHYPAASNSSFENPIRICGDYVYRLTEDGQALLSNYRGTETVLTVPAELDGHPLTVLGRAAFLGDQNLVEVTVPRGVVAIEDACFSECHHLQRVTLPDTLVTMGDSAFNRCEELSQLTLPDSLRHIGELAFFNCAALTELTLPAALETLGARPLDGSGWLAAQTGEHAVLGRWYVRCLSDQAEVTVPADVTFIVGAAFMNNTSVQRVTVPQGVTALGDYCFYGCVALTQLTLPDTVTAIGEQSFVDCRHLHVTAPAGSWAAAYAAEKGIPYTEEP